MNEQIYSQSQKYAESESILKREIEMLKSELFFKNQQINDKSNDTQVLGKGMHTKKATRETGVGTEFEYNAQVKSITCIRPPLVFSLEPRINVRTLNHVLFEIITRG